MSLLFTWVSLSFQSPVAKRGLKLIGLNRNVVNSPVLMLFNKVYIGLHLIHNAQ